MDKVPGSTGDTEAFLVFLEQPEYVAHPYTDTWLYDLDLTKPRSDSLVLVSYLKVLRETIHNRIQKWVPSLKVSVWFLNIEVGPPESAAITESFQSNKRLHGGPSCGTTSDNFLGSTAGSDATCKSKKRPRCAAKEVNRPASPVEELTKGFGNFKGRGQSDLSER